MLPVKLWFPLVLRNKNKTAEIKLFKSLYKRTPQNCGVLQTVDKALLLQGFAIVGTAFLI